MFDAALPPVVFALVRPAKLLLGPVSTVSTETCPAPPITKSFALAVVTDPVAGLVLASA